MSGRQGAYCDDKYYARDVGLLQEESLKLIKYGRTCRSRARGGPRPCEDTRCA